MNKYTEQYIRNEPEQYRRHLENISIAKNRNDKSSPWAWPIIFTVSLIINLIIFL